MNFTEEIDFTTFPMATFQSFSFDDTLITLEMFSFEYVVTSNKSYKIIMKPRGYTFLYNVTVTVTTMDMPSPEH